MNKATKTSAGKLIFWLFLTVFVWLAISRFAEAKKVFEVLSDGKWYWVGIAFICQIGFYYAYSYFTDQVFRLIGIDKLSVRKIFPILLASKFTNIALMLSTVGQVIVFVRNTKKEGFSRMKVGVGVALSMLFDLSAFALIALISIIILWLLGKLTTYISVAYLILIAAMGLVIFLLVELVYFKRGLTGWLLKIMSYILHLIGKKEVTAEQMTRVLEEVVTDFAQAGRKMWRGFYLAFPPHIINVVTLFFIFLAFTSHINPLMVISVYTVGLLFTIVSVTPQGIGFAEAAMVAAIHSFGIDLSTSAVITLAYRGLLYWLPFFVGFYFFERLELQNHKEAAA